MKFSKITGLTLFGAALAMAGVGACAKESREPAPAVSSPIDVSLAANAHFHSAGVGFQSMHRELSAKVRSSGEVEVTRKGVANTLLIKSQINGDSKPMSAPVLSVAGAVERTAGATIERIEMRDDGVEISWRLLEKPAGGDFVVRQSISHHGAIEQTAQGVRFPTEHLRVSHGTFIDAKGKATFVPAVVQGDSVEYRVAQETLESSAFPAVLDPTISAEAIVDPTSDAGYATQRDSLSTDPTLSGASVAFDGSNYFVAWFDSRGITPRLLGALVSPTGALLSTEEIVLGNTVESKSRYFNLYGVRGVKVISGPGGFLVLWSQTQIYGYEMPMLGQRVTSAGKVVDTTPIAFDTLPLGDLISFGTTADSFVLAYAIYTSGAEQNLRATFINGANVQDPGVRTVKSSVSLNSGKGEPEFNLVRLAGDIVLYSTYKSNQGNGEFKTYASRLGSTFSEPTELASVVGRLLDVAHDSTQNYVLSEGAGASQLRTLANDGVTLGAPLAITGWYAAQVSADENGLIVREPYYGSYTCRYTKTLVQSGACFTSTGAPMVLSPTKLAFISAKSDAPSRGMLASILFWDRTTGVPSTPSQTVLPHSSNSQFAPVVAYDPVSAAYLAVWLDDTAADSPIVPGATDGGITTGNSGGLQLMGARIRANGGAIQVDPAFPISPTGAEELAEPKIRWAGNQFVVAWRESRTVEGALRYRVMASKIAASGSTVSPPVEIGSSPMKPATSLAFAADTTGWLFAWAENADRVLAKRWLFNDTMPDSSPPLTVSSSDSTSRADLNVVFDGKQTTVAWLEGPFFVSSHIQAVLFANGASVPSAPSFALESAFAPKQNLRMASDEKGVLVAVWASFAGSGRREIRAKVIPRDAIANQDSSSIAVAPPSEDDNAYPSVAYANDSESFAIAWSRRRGASDWDIVANWLAIDGRVLDKPEGRVVSATTAAAIAEAGAQSEPGEDESLPELCTGPSPTTGLAYVRFDSRTGMRSLRARFRTIVSGRISGDTCSANDDCSSRYCVDGICCHTACNEGCGQCGGEDGSEKGQCAPKKSGTLCGAASRYACSGESTACSQSCDEKAANVCAPGLVCRDSQCSPFAAVCFDDYSAITETGPVSCAGYRCVAGACKGTCESAEDCAPGNVCDFKGRCGAAPEVENTAGCSSAPASERAGAFAFGALAIVGALAVRRRRPRTPKNCP